MTGEAVAIVEGVSRATGSQTGAAHFSVSETGTLVYIPGPVDASAGFGRNDAIGIDRSQGSHRAIAATAGYVSEASCLSGRNPHRLRDGRWQRGHRLDLRPVRQHTEAEAHIRRQQPVSRLVSGRETNRVSIRPRRRYRHILAGPPTAAEPPSVSRGRRPAHHTFLNRGHPMATGSLYSVETQVEAALWMLSVRDRKATPFGDVHSKRPLPRRSRLMDVGLPTPAPMGGKQAIYVQPFPPTGAKYQLMAKGLELPSHPVWSPDGNELFYNPRPRGSTSSASRPRRRLFSETPSRSREHSNCRHQSDAGLTTSRPPASSWPASHQRTRHTVPPFRPFR